jgi:alpha-L-fucosidase
MAAISIPAQSPQTPTGAPPADKMDWWREARFGMFIHWGLYSIPAGIWNGEGVHSDLYKHPFCEHIMLIAQIPIAEYEKLAGQFHPDAWNAERIVLAAKAAGMRYVILTGKHHDGFAMYDTAVNGYDTVDGTPWKRDPLRELADACAKHDMNLGVYYSLGRDWHHPDAVCQEKWNNNWDFPDSSARNYQKYLDEKVKPQLREILTNYGPVGVLWFDTPEQTTREQTDSLAALVRELQPETIINTRIGHRVGDYRSMGDNAIPDTGTDGDWETPGTMAESWGYSLLDTDPYWKSSTELIHKLIDIVSKGGNYLLNIGPDGEGALDPRAADRLDVIAQWMAVNAEAIHGTTASPRGRPDWGRYTRKGNVVYAFVFDWPEGGGIMSSIRHNTVEKCELLTAAGPQDLRWEPTHGVATMIYLPDAPPNPHAGVVRITLKEE